MNTKKGLSDVVTTLIIILLVIVAVGILWVVLRGMITKGTNQLSTTDFTSDLQIQKVTLNAGNVDVKVSLNQGETALNGILVLISDGNNSLSFEQMTPINIGEEKTLTITYNGTVKEVKISPIIIDDKGQKKIGQVSDTYEF